MYSILIVDDEPDILEFLSYNLADEGYEISTANNGKEAIKVAKKKEFDLIILDVMMPEMDGIETCHQLRELPGQANALIIFLTARGEDYSQLAGFDAGADDYLTKPIKPRILVKRISALLRRSNSKTDSKDERSGDLAVDKEKYVITKGEESFHLPKKEFELASLLMSKPGKVYSRDTILNAVWGDDVIVGDRTIDVHIRKLREKLGHEYFVTIKGVGYKFQN